MGRRKRRTVRSKTKHRPQLHPVCRASLCLDHQRLGGCEERNGELPIDYKVTDILTTATEQYPCLSVCLDKLKSEKNKKKTKNTHPHILLCLSCLLIGISDSASEDANQPAQYDAPSDDYSDEFGNRRPHAIPFQLTSHVDSTVP